MFIKRTTKHYKGKTYVNHLLVEAIATPKGPRHRVICALGALAPGPRAEWLALAHKLAAALQGQAPLFPDERVETLVAQVQTRPARVTPPESAGGGPALVTLDPARVTVEQAREAGPVHVGHHLWQRLGLDTILTDVGLAERTRQLTEVLTLNRLIAPASEHATPDWTRRTALPELLGLDGARLGDAALYRTLDQVHPQRVAIERALADRERTLFGGSGEVYLYDLSSSYFEGRCARNPQAQRGYSRDHRPDCKQVVVGLVLDRLGFPQAHEVFAGNRTDSTTLGAMLDALEERVGKREGATVVVDRGLATAENLAELRRRKNHYLVASRQEGRLAHAEAFADETGWTEVVRTSASSAPGGPACRVWVKRAVVGDEVHLLCRSEGRLEKDQAIRARQTAHWRAALERLATRVRTGKLVDPVKIQQAIGRLKERYARVARYYVVTHDAATRMVRWKETADRLAQATGLDGTYLLRTDRTDLSDEEIWRTYLLLTRVEAAFRAMKSPLQERPIFHQLAHRVQTHIFLCVLAYHLLVMIETLLRDRGLSLSWATVRERLRTQQVVTVVLPTTTGEVLTLRQVTTPEPEHREVYAALGIPDQVLPPIRTWQRA